MDCVIGTSKGLFVLDGATGTAQPVLRERAVRDIARVNGSILAGADTGCFRSDDGAATWQASGIDGRMVWHMTRVPATAHSVYAVTQPAGVFRSDDAGRTWAEVEGFTRAPGAERWCVPTKPPSPGRARTVVVDRSNPKAMWVGVEVGGVATTRNGGATWTVDQPGANPDIHVMVAHPAKPGVLFVSTGYGRIDGVAEQVEGNAGMLRSDDGGRSWTYVWKGMQPRYTRPLCVDPRAPYGVTVACAPTAFSSVKDPGGAQAMLYRTEDEGRTWRSLCDPAHSPSAANFHGLAPDPEVPGGVVAGTETGEVWRVSDEGKWTQCAAGLPSVLSILPLRWRI
jgi:photosystem II stability/assembly factor-like uncharacterized protein